MLTSYAVEMITNRMGHPYEDRFRILGSKVPVVARAGRGELFAVMDGVGGAVMGMRAAQHVADTLLDFFRDPAIPPSALGLLNLLKKANDAVYDWGLTETGRTLGACAATIAWLSPPTRADAPGRLVILHVGDTAAAIVRDEGSASWLTHDHSKGRVLRNFVGIGPSFEVENHVEDITPADVIVLVSDGVTRAFGLSGIEAVVRERTSPEQAARDIARLSRAAGSKDDITAIVVELEDWEDDPEVEDH